MRSMGKANDVHVVKDFKLNIDPCVVGNTAAQHVQLLKICAHLFMICIVCYFCYFSPCGYCVHVRDYCCVVLVHKA